MPDHLRDLPIQAVAAWYRRLADRVGREPVNGEVPLATRFLRQYLDNRDPNSTFSFEAPMHLRNSSYVLGALQYHRRVFLTEERARLTGGRMIWAGVVPRLRGLPGFTQWHPGQLLKMTYRSLVDIPLRLQHLGTREEQDLLTAFHGFQLSSEVSVQGVFVPNSNNLRILFLFWGCRATDRYDFNFNEFFTVPNPDFGVYQPGSVAPSEAWVTVFHRNAQRLEQAGLAAPYNIETKWQLFDSRISGPGLVDWSRNPAGALTF